MSHIGMLCPPTPGHYNAMTALGRTLCARGHCVTIFQLPDLRARMEREGLNFWPLADGQAKTGELAQALEQLGRVTGLAAVRYTIRLAAKLAQLVLDSAPAALREAKVDLALVDQNEPAGASAAEHIGLPFVSVATALPLNREPNIPPAFAPWPYAQNRWGRARNWIGYVVSDRLLSPVTNVLNRRREQWKLPLLHSPDDSFSRSCQLCTLPKGFDFSRQHPPANFHYVGPFIDASRSEVPFPWERLDGRPLIYASFGTLQNRRQELFHSVAEACADLDVQLVLSAGGGEVDTGSLPGSPLVVKYAPQLELLARASLAITHAGLNTVLEALNVGVPMVAIPVTNDQPAVASRVKCVGAGEVVPLTHLSSHRLRAAIDLVLGDENYRRRAQRLMEQIKTSGGAQRAAEIVEQQLA
jgi:zeaxanthin glucosyltransferase